MHTGNDGPLNCSWSPMARCICVRKVKERKKNFAAANRDDDDDDDDEKKRGFNS